VAVVSDDPLDIALSEIGELVDRHQTDTLAGASAVAGLWRTVYDRAMDRSDFALALLAAREWCLVIRVIRALTGSLSPPT